MRRDEERARPAETSGDRSRIGVWPCRAASDGRERLGQLNTKYSMLVEPRLLMYGPKKLYKCLKRFDACRAPYRQDASDGRSHCAGAHPTRAELTPFSRFDSVVNRALGAG